MPEDKKKFLFNLHDFGDKSDEDDGPPPPPMFSEDELAKAKAESYEQGKKDGFEESQNSLENKIAALLGTSGQSFMELQSAEGAREARYEQEAVHLALVMFKSIYPAWVEEFGAIEVENAITSVLKGAANQQEIIIDVAPSLFEPIQERLKPVIEKLTNVKVAFEAQDDLSPSDMRMRWKNGGAVRNTHQLSEQILQMLKNGISDEVLATSEPEEPCINEDLAEAPETGQNEMTDTENPDE